MNAQVSISKGPVGAMAEWTGRIVWWRAHHGVSCQGPSPARPFEAIQNWERCFTDRDALEIGPGAGRQSSALIPLCRSYTVADIVPEVLALPIYSEADRFQIRNYETDRLGRRFGAVTFWYLVHHIREDELDSFFAFVAAHASDDASIMFNIPGPAPARTLLAAGPGDGRRTTSHDPQRIRDCMSSRGFALRQEVIQDFSSHVMLWTRSD